MTEKPNEDVLLAYHFKKLQEKAIRWDKLKTWLNNLLVLNSVNKTEKKGITIALNVMSRIEEGETS